MNYRLTGHLRVEASETELKRRGRGGIRRATQSRIRLQSGVKRAALESFSSARLREILSVLWVKMFLEP